MIAPVPAAHAVSLARPSTSRGADGPSAPIVCPSTITVASTADGGVGSLREAINTVCDGGTINFSLTLPAIITLTTGALDITRTVTISGPPDPSNLTVRGNNLSSVFSISSGSVSISGLTITNGNNVSADGGGILNAGALTLTNSIVMSNTANVNGGGLYSSNSLSLSNTTIISNTAIQGGGGIRNDGLMMLTNVKILSNTAATGGGILVGSGVLTLTGVTVRGNRAHGGGGGVSNFSTLNITNSTLLSNTADSSGGGISNSGAMTITNSAVVSNTATSSYGGGIENNSGSVKMINVTVSDNSTQGHGGGLASDNLGGIIELANVTVANNTAPGGMGGGIDAFFGAISLTNTIVANNPGGNCAGAGITSGGHNLEDANDCSLAAAGDLTNTVPFFGPLANNGGATLTRALLPGSPAINAGDNSGCPPTDQRGAPRPRTAANPCDIGAYEAEYLFLPIIEK